jgi:serpin B
MKYSLIISIILIAVLLIGSSSYACQPPLVQTPVEKPGETPPVTSQSDLEALVAGNNTFAFDAYQMLKDNGNIFYSPYSISLALAMTYAGARDSTEQQMADTLHYNLPQELLHPSFNSLNTELSQRGQGAQDTTGQGFKLNIVNAIWGQRDYVFLQSFLDTLAENYGAEIRLLDFMNAPESSRITINDWVSNQTEGKISDLIPQGTINTLTRLVLTNAIYFNTAWQNTFSKDLTYDGIFHLLNGNEVTVPMMHQTEQFTYTKGSDYVAVELPYDGNQISMLILLPQTGKFTEFEESLDAAKVDDILQNLKPRRVGLTMPKFEFNSSFNLNETLSKLGMPLAFTPTPPSGICSKDYADFSGMDGRCDLYISNVIHKAFVSVDESGTEAAAATAVVMVTSSAPIGEIVSLVIDRPLIFLIRDIQTGTILFIGRVMNPGN